MLLADSWVHGDAVEGNYGASGEWFAATIVAVNADGSFDLAYEDGDKETRVADKLIRPASTDPNTTTTGGRTSPTKRAAATADREAAFFQEARAAKEKEATAAAKRETAKLAAMTDEEKTAYAAEQAAKAKHEADKDKVLRLQLGKLGSPKGAKGRILSPGKGKGRGKRGKGKRGGKRGGGKGRQAKQGAAGAPEPASAKAPPPDTSLAGRLAAFFATHDPGRVEVAGVVAEQFAGREADLVQSLAIQYGVEESKKFQVAASAPAAATPAAAAAPEAPEVVVAAAPSPAAAAASPAPPPREQSVDEFIATAKEAGPTASAAAVAMAEFVDTLVDEITDAAAADAASNAASSAFVDALVAEITDAAMVEAAANAAAEAKAAAKATEVQVAAAKAAAVEVDSVDSPQTRRQLITPRRLSLVKRVSAQMATMRHRGGFLNGGDLESRTMTLDEAKAFCAERKDCKGFSYKSPDAKLRGHTRFYFKTAAGCSDEHFVPSDGWSTFCKAPSPSTEEADATAAEPDAAAIGVGFQSYKMGAKTVIKGNAKKEKGEEEVRVEANETAVEPPAPKPTQEHDRSLHRFNSAHRMMEELEAAVEHHERDLERARATSPRAENERRPTPPARATEVGLLRALSASSLEGLTVSDTITHFVQKADVDTPAAKAKAVTYKLPAKTVIKGNRGLSVDSGGGSSSGGGDEGSDDVDEMDPETWRRLSPSKRKLLNAKMKQRMRRKNRRNSMSQIIKEETRGVFARTASKRALKEKVLSHPSMEGLGDSGEGGN